MGSGGIPAIVWPAIVWAIVVLGLLWLGVAVWLSIIAARRFRVAEQVLGVARSSAALLELAPSRPLVVRPDDRIEVDAQLLRELGLNSSVTKLSDLTGSDAGLAPDDLDERAFSNLLYTAGQPDPDLLIRTSGEMRVSNFLLWQIAYAEIWVTDTLWPDFRRRHLLEAVLAYQKRDRRYGGINPTPALSR